MTTLCLELCQTHIVNCASTAVMEAHQTGCQTEVLDDARGRLQTMVEAKFKFVEAAQLCCRGQIHVLIVYRGQ
jgi:hypothetical protein